MLSARPGNGRLKYSQSAPSGEACTFPSGWPRGGDTRGPGGQLSGQSPTRAKPSFDLVANPTANGDLVAEHHEVSVYDGGVGIEFSDLGEEVLEVHDQETGVGPVLTVTNTPWAWTLISSFGLSWKETWCRPLTRTR